MRFSELLTDHMSVPVAKAVTAGSVVVAGAVWLIDFEIWARILASMAGFFAGICGGLYWLYKLRRERKYTENESGL